MAIQFGRTWWGQQWLQSLAHVDYSNRLPRGASYARSGHVLNLEIEKNTIKAKVQGSHKSPYKVYLEVPLFDKNKTKTFIDKLISRPAVISQLFNRTLAPDALSIANEAALQVFPKSWNDLTMRCSCPDGAVPCKHIAAVIFKVSQKIDMNPFFVFEMHGLDLIKEIANQGIDLFQQKRPNYVFFQSLFKIDDAEATDLPKEIYHPTIDFSRLNDLTSTLPKLLPDSPAFYNEGNFRQKFEIFYLICVREATKVLSGKNSLEEVLSTTISTNPLNFKSQVEFLFYPDKGLFYRPGETNDSVSRFLAYILNINKDRLADYHPTLVSSYRLIQAALHFIAKGAIIPQLFKHDHNQYIIKWLPALIDPEAQKILQTLEETISRDLFSLIERKGKKEIYYSLQNPAYILLCILIDHIIFSFRKQHQNDFLLNFFFYPYASAFLFVGQEATPDSIYKWLECLHINNSRIKPVFEINLTPDDEFGLKILFEGISNQSTPISLETLLGSSEYLSERFKALQVLTLLSAFIPNLDQYINQGGRRNLTYDNTTFAKFLTEMIPAIRMLGLKVVLPKALQTLLRPKRSIKVTRREAAKGYLRLDELLDFDWQVAIGDHLITIEEFNGLLTRGESLVRFKQEFFYINQDELIALRRSLLEKKSSSPGQQLQSILSGEFEGARISLTPEVQKIIKELTTERHIKLPSTIKATLRPYQERGFSWMYRNAKIGFGSIIADDMGLGKTLQVITLLAKLKEEKLINVGKRVLIVMPTGLLTNWKSEIGRFAPELTCEIFHGATRDLKAFDSDILLTSYGVMRSDSMTLKKLKWYLLVIDEAQNIKNQDTAQTKALKSIPADIRIAMSGTPVENRLEEFWSIMDFVNKGYLGNTKSFRSEYSMPIQMDNDAKVIERFKKVTSPFLMRRMKSDKSIITDLPDKIEMDQLVTLTGDQAALYQQTLKEAMKEISGITDSDSKSLFKRQGLVLQMILALKQICNHPTQFLKDGQTDGMLSGKIQLLYDLLDSILEVNEKVLIFTQFKEMGDLLVRFLKDRYHEEPLFYHGGCSVKQREELIERFQKGHRDNIFILSLKAAGTGLNLTAASHVIHYDLWWNPAVENQATDRAYRIGQHKNVMVHRLICSNTFEEKINEMIRKKRDLAEMTVTTGENWIGKMSNSELAEIFRP